MCVISTSKLKGCLCLEINIPPKGPGILHWELQHSISTTKRSIHHTRRDSNPLWQRVPPTWIRKRALYHQATTAGYIDYLFLFKIIFWQINKSIFSQFADGQTTFTRYNLVWNYISTDQFLPIIFFICRWTDNIYALQSWIGRKFPSIDVRDLNKQFGVPEDLDYVQWINRLPNVRFKDTEYSSVLTKSVLTKKCYKVAKRNKSVPRKKSQKETEVFWEKSHKKKLLKLLQKVRISIRLGGIHKWRHAHVGFFWPLAPPPLSLTIFPVACFLSFQFPGLEPLVFKQKWLFYLHFYT